MGFQYQAPRQGLDARTRVTGIGGAANGANANAFIAQAIGTPAVATDGVEHQVFDSTTGAIFYDLQVALSFANSGGAGQTSMRVQITLDDNTTRSFVTGAAMAAGAGAAYLVLLAAAIGGVGATVVQLSPYGLALSARKIIRVQLFATSTSNAPQTVTYDITAQFGA